MKNPIVSVIIPVHNGEQTLKNCLDSALKQDFKEYEILVVDNSSTDKTKRIILGCQKEDSRLKYIFEGKKGRGSARNAGINRAKGKVIAMTDSDCILPANWLAEITKPILMENENIAVGRQKSYESGFWQSQLQRADWEFIKQRINRKYISHIDTKNFAIKSSLIRKLMFDPHIKNLEDFEFKLRAEERSKIRFLPGIKVVHVHKNSFLKVVFLGFDRGYWATRIYLKNRKNKKQSADPMFESISAWNFIKFPFWMAINFLKMPLKNSFFEFIWEISWRAGIACAIFAKPNS